MQNFFQQFLWKAKEAGTMYRRYYNFGKEPFHITPDPAFLFPSRSHQKALNAISYGIENRKGLICVTGEVGVGKTTILRHYLENADSSRVKVICFFDPLISFQHILKTLHREMGIEVQTEDICDAIGTLREALLKECAEGRTVAVIFDDAQDIPLVTIENLKKFTNLETARDKLIQIVFMGQPEFEQMLDRNDMRQVRQRMAVRANILPLSREESELYIRHRLNCVATDGTPVFTKGALKKIIRHADGIPRCLNVLCDNALKAGYELQEKPVSSKIAKEVVVCYRKERKPASLKRALASIFAFLVQAGVLFIPL
jgi:general secretion pathway protein A